MVVREEAEAREAPAGERLSWVGMLRTLEDRNHVREPALAPRGGVAVRQTYLYCRWNAVDDLDGAAVGVSRQRLADAVDLHLALRLRARFLPVDGFTGGTLQTAVLQGGHESFSGSVTRSHDPSVFFF